MRLLLAEDELALSRALKKILEKHNYAVDTVTNGEDALSYLTLGNYDVCIMDIMMPRLDGISALLRARSDGITTPVLILSAKSEISDRILGLDSGANYYLTKPFETTELLAVLRAITRTDNSSGVTVTLGNITLNRRSYELSSSKGSFRLANKEFQMMELLMLNPSSLISSERFMEKIWGYDTETDISVVWVYISYLRKKLSALSANLQIKAMRNAGYSLEIDDDKEA